MKHLKTYESKKNEPKVGDYAIIKLRGEFLHTIVKIIHISKGKNHIFHIL